METICIIIPVRNGSRHLPDALQSVEAQDRSPDEVVIVDDASEDASRAIAESWARRMPFGVQVLQQSTRRGACAARNRGVEATRSGLIQFLDADDVLHPGRLSTMANALQSRSDAGLAWSDFTRFDRTPPDFNTAGSAGTIWVPGRELPMRISTFGWTILFRRELLLRIGGWDESLPIWQDFNLTLRAAASTQGGIQVRAVLNGYRQSTEGRISNAGSRKQRFLGRLRALRKTERAAEQALPEATVSLKMRINRERYHLFRSMLGELPTDCLRPLLRRVWAGPAALPDRLLAGALLAAETLAPGFPAKLKAAIKGNR